MVAGSRGEWFSLGPDAKVPSKAAEHPLQGILGVWSAENRLTEGLALSIGPEDGVVGKGALPQLRGLGHPLQLGPGLANVL